MLLLIVDFGKLKGTSFISVGLLHVFLIIAYANLLKKQWSVN